MSVTAEAGVLAGMVRRLTAIELAVGRLVPVPRPWIDATLINSWGNWGSVYDDVQYRKEGDLVRIRGLARKDAAVTTDEVMFTLDADYRPPNRVLHQAFVSGTVTGGSVGRQAERIDIDTNGEVRPQFAMTSTSGNWVNFEVVFSTV